MPAGATFDKCMKQKMTSPITTSKGSQDIRNEINRLMQQVQCWALELKTEVARLDQAATAARLKSVAADAARDVCIKKLGMTSDQWIKKYGSAKTGPCVKESEAGYSAFARFDEARSTKAWTQHDAWLKALTSIGRLASVYPDSVQPARLSWVLDASDAAKACIAKKQWCYKG